MRLPWELLRAGGVHWARRGGRRLPGVKADRCGRRGKVKWFVSGFEAFSGE